MIMVAMLLLALFFRCLGKCTKKSNDRAKRRLLNQKTLNEFTSVIGSIPQRKASRRHTLKSSDGGLYYNKLKSCPVKAVRGKECLKLSSDDEACAAMIEVQVIVHRNNSWSDLSTTWQKSAESVTKGE